MIKAVQNLEGNIISSGELIGELNNSIITIPPILQEKTVVPTKEKQEIIPDEGYTGLSRLLVWGIESEEIKIIPSEEEQVKNGLFDKITIDAIQAEEKTVELDFSESDTVNVTNEEGKYLKKVTINKDENLIPDNIKSGITINGIEGSAAVADFEITDGSYLFYRGSRLNAINELIDTIKNITDMSYMFYMCNELTSVDLSKVDTSKVTNMSHMLEECRKLATIDLSNFNTSLVKDMRYMFSFCNALTSLDLGSFDTSNVTNMEYMFQNCANLKSINASSFKTSLITSMSYMFSYCSNLTSLDLRNFDTSKVTSMYYMFNRCTRLKTLDISSFDSTKLTNTMYMFYYCSSLTTLIINNPNVFKIKSTDAFTGTPIKSGTGYVYVPDDLVETYKTTQYWSTYANQIKPISELEGYNV